MNSQQKITLTSGSLGRNILLFSIPLMLSNVLQVLFNMSDIAVVGRFAGSHALGSVGSTSILVTLFTGFLIGVGSGINVNVARYLGCQSDRDVSETVHTSAILCVIIGTIALLIGVLGARPMMQLLGTKDELIDGAIQYLQIYFLGMPALAVYNFGNAVLSAAGDTRRPLIIMIVAGIVNVILNLFFVIVCQLSVAGVAIATVVAQAVSTTLIILCMIRSHSVIHLQRDMLRIHGDKLKEIVRVGLPAGLQGTIFSISNVLIQSSINSFGSIAIAGNSASSNLEGFMYTSMNSVYQAALSFAGQNMGARKYSRLKKVLCNCLAIVTGIGIGMGAIMYLFRYQLLGIYSSDMDVINFGIERLELFCLTYFTCGAMDVMVGQMRGMGYSIVPMIVSLVGVCGIRIVWIFTVFKASNSLLTLYMSYPVSWVVTLAVHFSTFLYVYHKVKQRTDGVPDVPTVKA